MERSNKFAARRTSRFPGSPDTRQGKFTLVVLIAILGMMVIIGFVGNAGYIVTEKMNTQNAADAIAFSSAQWMARGMNSVTATNHLLGEITGLVVVIEALGGPEADREMEAYPPQSRVTDSINQNFVDLAVINGLAVYGAPAAGKVDKPFVNAIVTKLVSRKDAKHKAFATIYDAKLQLKKSTAKRLIAKSIANAGLWVPPPWGWLSAIAAYVVHIKMNADLLLIGKEYVILEGFERLVTSGIVRNLKVKVIEEKLIPAIAAHGDYLAGRNSMIAKKRPKVNSNVVNNAITESLKHLSKVYNVKAAIYPTNETKGVPGTQLQLAKLRLPIAPEAPPSMSGTATGKYEPEWGTDEVKESDDEDPIAKIQRELADARKKAEQRIKELNEQIKMLEGLWKDVQELKEATGVTQEERAAFQKEQGEITTDIAEKKKTLKEREDDLVKIKEQQKKIDEAKAELAKIPPGTGNLSMRPQHLALTGIQSSGAANGTREVGMNMAEERTTQWVRATYPYVDAFRAPILAMFREHLDISDAADHYKKWTDRYTLTKSWQFRSGFMFDGKKGSEAVATWKKDSRTEPLRMYLMVETFDPDKAPGIAKPGAKRIQKGYEVWTKGDKKGKEMAEKMITVVGMTQRDITPFFSKVLFPVANKHGMTTFAQALYYNSNEQKPGTLGKPGKTQANLGWDTLNWDPKTTVPEWGTELTKSKAKWPWDLFTSSTDWQGNARVKLNWQAKLMPVTHSRLLPATAAATIESTDMAQNIKWVLPSQVFEKMVTH
jgi:TolA-binding protein